MDDDGDDKIAKIPVKFKEPLNVSAPMLQVVETYGAKGCNHLWTISGHQVVNATYLVREGETEVECGLCNTKLDPMFVLRHLAHEENKWRDAGRRYQEEMARLKGRVRTKCQNCGQMTRISRT